MIDTIDQRFSWYDQEKNGIIGHRLKNKYSNIIISSAPMLDGLKFEDAVKIDHYINVSSTPFEMNSYNHELNSQFHWFPMQEVGFMGFQTLYGFINTMNKIYDENTDILIHCEAGCNRSPTMSLCWLLSKEKSIKKALKYVDKGSMIEEIFKSNIKYGLIPNIKDQLKFYLEIDKGEYLDIIIFENPQLERYTTGIETKEFLK